METVMKLLRCDFGDGTPRPGIEYNGCIIDIRQTELSARNFVDLLTKVTSNNSTYIQEQIKNRPKSASVNESNVDILAPLASNGRFFALGGVYTEHQRERSQSLLTVPAQWLVPKSGIVGPNEPVLIPDRVRESVMPAVELCLVIGKGGRYIEEQDAMDHVAGYTVSNDITARTEWPGPMAYKLMNTFTPCGPGVRPENEVTSPTSLEMTLHQKEDCICRGSTAAMRFTLPFLVRLMSSILELRPGDIIATGDPGHVQEGLKVGETIQTAIEEIGTLKNPIQIE